MSKFQAQRNSLKSRRIALALAATFFVSTQGPIFVGLAAPGFFVRPNLGVSRTPLGVMSFGAPGFGEVSDAINLANGNVYLGTDTLSKNNTPSSDPSNANSIGGAGWTTTNRVRLNGFSSTLTSAPGSLGLELGDQSTMSFQKQASVDWVSAPKWIQRYQSAIGAAFSFYKIDAKDGVAFQPDWIVLRIKAGETTFAHYYAANGTRYTFGFDGINADFMQSLDQQYRSAKQGRPEGRPMDGSSPFINGAWPGTDFSYYDTGKGLISVIRDEYGRTTRYEWNANQTLKQINELVTDPLNADSYTRRTDFAYLPSNLISTVTYTAKDGRGGTLARTVSFAYESDGRISKITRATKGGSRITSYFYNAANKQLVARVSTTDGGGALLEPDVFYNYSGSGYEAAFVPGLSTTVVDTTVNSNNCPNPATGSMLVPNDGGNDGQAVFLGCNASVATYTVPAGVQNARYRVSLRAKAQELDGPPIAEVKLNGTTIATPSWTGNTYRDGDIAEATVKAGDLITVGFTNDKCGTDVLPCNAENDRNLFVDTITLNKIGATLNTSTNTFTDAAATDSIATNVPGNGNVAVILPNDLVKGFYTIRVRARGDQYQGAPILEVKQDGATIASTTVPSATYKTYTVGGANLIPGGTLAVNFPNDFANTGGDRNLYVDNIELEQVYSTQKKSRILSVTQGDKAQEYEIDQFDRLRRKSVTDTNSIAGTVKTLEWRYEYYKSGNLALEVEPSGKTTHYAYDLQGRLVRSAVYKSNPFGPNYQPTVDAGLEITGDADYVFARGDRVNLKVTVVNDLSRQGVAWTFKDDGGSAMSPSNFNESASTSVNSDGVYTLTASFDAPNFAVSWSDSSSPKTRTGYSIALRTKNGGVVKQITYAVSTKVRSLALTNVPSYVIIAPSCVQSAISYNSGNAQCDSGLTVGGSAEVYPQFAGLDSSLVFDWVAGPPGLALPSNSPTIALPYPSDPNFARDHPDDQSLTLRACSAVERDFCTTQTIQIRYMSLQNTDSGDLPSDRWDSPSPGPVPSQGSLPTYVQLAKNEYKKLAVRIRNKPNNYSVPVSWSITNWYSYMNDDYYARLVGDPLAVGTYHDNDYRGVLDQNGCFTAPSVGHDGALWYYRSERRYILIRATLPVSGQYIENWFQINHNDNAPTGFVPFCGPLRALIIGSPPPANGNPSTIGYSNWGNVIGSGGSGTPISLGFESSLEFISAVQPGYETLQRLAYDNTNRIISSYRRGTLTPINAGGLVTQYKGVEQTNAYSQTVYTDTGSNQAFELLNKVTSTTYVGGTLSQSGAEPSGYALDMTGAYRKRWSERNFNDRGLPSQEYAYPNIDNYYVGTTWKYWSTDAGGNVSSLVTATLPAVPGTTALTALQYPDQVSQINIDTNQFGNLSNSVQSKVQRFAYDALGNPVQVTLEGVAGDVTSTVTAEVAATATAPKIPGTTTDITATKWNRVTDRGFNGFGQTIWERVTLQDGAGVVKNLGSERGMTYAATGELLSEWSGNAKNLTKYSYNASNRLTTAQRGVGDGTWSASSVLNPVRQEMQYAYDEFGRPSSVKEKNQTATTTTYDSLDRTIKAVKPDGSSVQTQYAVAGSASEVKAFKPGGTLKTTTSSTFDSLGRLTTETMTPTDGSPSYTLSYQYDIYGRTLAVTHSDTSLSASDLERTTAMQYDEEGNLTFQRGMTMRGVDGGFVGTADSRQAATQMVYDNSNRRIETRVRLYGAGTTVDAGTDTATTRARYDAFGNLFETRDANGYTSSLAFDAAGNAFASSRTLWKGTEAAEIPGKGASTFAITGAAFDAAGRAVKVVDAAGGIKQVRYDTLGNKTAEVDERGYVTKGYTYTDDGLPLGVWEPKFGAGSAAQIGSYNFANPAVQSGTTNPSGHVLTQFNIYDATTNRPYPTKILRAVASDTGQLTNTGTGGAESSYTYDWAGRVKTATLPADAQGTTHTITQSYDESGNTTQVIDADGFTTTFKFDYRNKVTEQKLLARSGNATDSSAGLSGGLTSSFKYDAFGNLTQKNERGLITDYAYNSLGKAVAESRPRKSSVSLSTAGFKRFAYRLDGEKVGETNYSYAGTFVNQPSTQVTVTAVPADFATAGNRMVFELDPGTRVVKEASYGYFHRPSGLAGTDITNYNTALQTEKIVSYTYNGLNLRVKRDFDGNPFINANQRDATGLFLRKRGLAPWPSPSYDNDADTAYRTYSRYDNRGKLLEQYDQNAAITATNSFNRFTYEYSSSQRESKVSRDIRVRAPAMRQASGGAWADTTLGGTILLAATVGSTTTTFNERDLLLKTTVSDQSANNIKDLSAATSRVTDYLYFADGSKKQVTVNDAQTSGGNSTVKYTYDLRGREVKLEDSNGGRDSRRDEKDQLLPVAIQNNISGIATILTEYLGGGQKRSIVKDGSGVCKYQDDRMLTLGGQVAERKEWEFQPNDSDKGVSYAAFSCGQNSPTRHLIMKYTASGDTAQTSIDYASTNVELARYFFGTSTTKQTNVLTYDNQFGQNTQEVGTIITNNFGKNWETAEVCTNQTIAVTNTGDAAVTVDSTFCDGSSSSVTIAPHSTGFRSEAVRRMVDVGWGADGSFNESITRLKTTTTIFNKNGNSVSEGRNTLKNGQSVIEDGDGQSNFILASNGNRIKVLGGKYADYVKRHDADGQAEMFFKWLGTISDPIAQYSDFRRDPLGSEILSSTAGLKQILNTTKYEIVRDSNASYFTQGDLQGIRKRVGKYGNYATIAASDDYNSAQNSSIRDESYTLADGIVDGVKWSAVVPFSVVPNTSGQYVLEAPQKPLSTQTGIDPSSVTPPNSSAIPNSGGPNSQVTPPQNGSTAPSLPSQVDPPEKKPTQSGSNTSNLQSPTSPQSSTSVSTGDKVSAPAAGVTVTSQTTQTQTPTSGKTSPPATANPNNAGQIQGLQSPTSVLPPSIGSSNASAISAPQGNTSSVTPNTGVNSSGVTAPQNSPTPNTGTSTSSVTTPAATSSVVPSVTGKPDSTTSSVRPPITGNSGEGQVTVLAIIEVPTGVSWEDFQNFISDYLEKRSSIEAKYRKDGQITMQDVQNVNREMSNWLADRIISRARNVLGEPYLTRVTFVVATVRAEFNDPAEQVAYLLYFGAVVYYGNAKDEGVLARYEIDRQYNFALALRAAKQGKSLDGLPFVGSQSQRPNQFYSQYFLNPDGTLNANGIKTLMIAQMTDFYGYDAKKGLETRENSINLTLAALKDAAQAVSIVVLIYIGGEAVWAVMQVVRGVLTLTVVAGASLRQLGDQINPGGVNAQGRGVNCVYCAIATDSTVRGNAASALPVTLNSYGSAGGQGVRISVLTEQYGGSFTGMSVRQIEQFISNGGPGTQGIVVGLRFLSAHAFNVVNQNGKAVFIDGQSGTLANLSDGYVRFLFLTTRLGGK
jgi:YD repeat-containing protein